jgi:hypothetical protein
LVAVAVAVLVMLEKMLLAQQLLDEAVMDLIFQ